MLFFSKSFLFIFFPILAILSYLSVSLFKNLRLYKVILIIFSIIFYGVWSYKFLLLFLALIYFNFTLTNSLIGLQDKKKYLYVIFGIIANLFVLIYFKYFNFLIENINQIFSLSFNLKKIILPLGISFITFQQISYLVNSLNFTKRKKLIDFFFFSMFFPQIIAGPILIFNDIDNQLKKNFPFLRVENIWKGIQIFFLGVFKKIFIADNLEPLVSKVFDQSLLTEFGSIDMFIGLVAYGLQLYFDFSAYSDMAIGLALIFGIVLPINFNSPYKSQSISEFWGRWHITLNRFLENLIFLPLSLKFKRTISDNKYSNVKIVVYATLITFLISGIWHGAGWTFILWGLYHGIFVGFHRVYNLFKNSNQNNKPTSIKIIFNILLTNIVVFLSWVLFRSNDLGSALEFYSILFNFLDGSWIRILEFENIKSFLILLSLLFCCLFLPNSFQVINYKFQSKKYFPGKFFEKLLIKIRKYYLDLFLIAFLLIYYLRFSFENKPFIYYQF